MIVTFKNRAKTVFSHLEGVYELTANLASGLPKWKMVGERHEIRSHSSYEWYIYQDGSNNKLYTNNQPYANERMPDDPNYNWKMYDRGWKNTAPGDVNIQGIL